MEKDLRMEVFSSKDMVRTTCLHVYQLHTQKIDNSFSIIRGAAWKLRNYFHVGVFEDGKRIFIRTFPSLHLLRLQRVRHYRCLGRKTQVTLRANAIDLFMYIP